MAGSAAASAWGPGPRGNGGLWGHISHQVLIGAILIAVLLVVRPLPPRHPVALVVPVLLIGVVLVTWHQMRRHDRSLCERCMAGMPLDAAATAHRFRRRFAMAHLATHRPALLAMIGTLIATDLALVVVPSAARIPVQVLWSAAHLSLVYLVLAHTTHRRLQPWCPWCRDGGGGSEVSAPEPSPSGHGRL